MRLSVGLVSSCYILSPAGLAPLSPVDQPCMTLTLPLTSSIDLYVGLTFAGKPKPAPPPESDLIIVKPDPADTPKQAAEKMVWSFLVLFENLVSARTLLKSLQEASLLVAPAPGQPPLTKGTETATAEAFVKKLQVMLLMSLLYWVHQYVHKTHHAQVLMALIQTGVCAAATSANLFAYECSKLVFAATRHVLTLIAFFG